jgi:hypothetical protein
MISDERLHSWQGYADEGLYANNNIMLKLHEYFADTRITVPSPASYLKDSNHQTWKQNTIQGGSMEIQATASSSSSADVLKAMVQEATETASVTKAEAAKGDQQAIRKLSMQQPQHAPVSPEGVGKKTDVTA